MFAALAAAAIISVPSASFAQESCGSGCTAHYVGAGSSAQFLMSAVAQDQAALDANSALYGNANTVKHFTLKNGAYISDSRNADITNEVGSFDVVWIQDGSGNVTDLWLDVQVDSTVGVRAFSAQESSGSGDTVTTTGTTSSTPGALVATNIWPDNKADSNLTTQVIAAVNSGLHVNVGLTDIRPEDALFATNRALGYPVDTNSWKSLGYQGPVPKLVGAPINTDQSTGTNATPIAFALSGKVDPISKLTARTYTTVPIGAAPIVFITNNNGTETITNLVTGITPGAHITGQTYPLANLFDGTSSCDTDSTAFGGNGDGLGTPLQVFLREPLSGTMNTTEWSLFRSFDNALDSQEKGITNPTRSPYNPLHLKCGASNNLAGLRSRAIGTGEVVGNATSTPPYGLLGIPNSLGYIFYGFANAAKFKGSASFNYLTIDGVDPIWDNPTAYSVCVGGTSAGQVCGTNEPCGGGGTCTAGGSPSQTVPYCGALVCTSDLWGATGTFPNLRNGTYKAWSIYRWLVDAADSDPYGPTLVAQEAQNYVNQDIVDFVPFSACTPGTFPCTTPNDGLSVYHSHYAQSGVTGVNGPVSETASGNNADTLGGGTEAGGDMGGYIVGPFGITTPDANGYVTWASTLTSGKGYHVTWKQGDKFLASWAQGSDVTLAGTAQTIASCKTGCTVSVTSFYVTNPNPNNPLIQVSYSKVSSTSHNHATTPGTLNKHQ